MCDWFADRVIALSESREPFLAGLLTLSSHTPFDVPYAKFDDRVLNAMAFSDDCVGKMIDRLKASPAWENLLVVLVADHGYPWPRSLSYNEPLRHRIPMIWTGGAVAGPRVVEEYASQIDICATILGQLEVAHDDFDYSKDIFAPDPPPQVRVLHLQRRLRRGRCFGRSRLGRHERESGFRDISRPDGRGPYDAADHLYRHRKPLTAGKIPEIRYCGT